MPGHAFGGCFFFCHVISRCFEGKELDEENEELTVALPCDSVRKRTELVGFLLHPVPRSETWRSLSFFQAD
jgi:hypothetical protein